MVGQYDPFFVPTTSLMKTPTLSTDDPAQEDLLQKCQEQMERLSQQNRVIKFCNLQTKTILTRGSEFFMVWTSWSRTWATTRRTTTTSRKPLKCSSKILRWKRMYLLLRVDQKLKQNHEDILLPAHPQELYQSMKNIRRILGQKFYSSIAYPVFKTTEYSSSSWWSTSRSGWSDCILEIEGWSAERFYEQNTNGILHVRGSYEQGTQRSRCNCPCCTASCLVQAENVEKTPRHGVLGRHKNLLKRKDLSSIKHDRTQSSFTTHSQHIESRRLSWRKLEKSCTRKCVRHLDLFRRFLWWQLDEEIGFRSCWRWWKLITNPTKNQKSNC